MSPVSILFILITNSSVFCFIFLIPISRASSLDIQINNSSNFLTEIFRATTYRIKFTTSSKIVIIISSACSLSLELVSVTSRTIRANNVRYVQVLVLHMFDFLRFSGPKWYSNVFIEKFIVLHAVEIHFQNADNEARIGLSLQDENPTGELCRQEQFVFVIQRYLPQ